MDFKICELLKFEFECERLSKGGNTFLMNQVQLKTFTPRQKNQKALFLIKWVLICLSLFIFILSGGLRLNMRTSKYNHRMSWESEGTISEIKTIICDLKEKMFTFGKIDDLNREVSWLSAIQHNIYSWPLGFRYRD